MNPIPAVGNQIKSKHQFLLLSASGKLGNTLRTWWSADSVVGSGFTGAVTIRNRVRDSPYFVPRVRVADVHKTAAGLQRQGAEAGSFYYQELPHEPRCCDAKCEGCGRTINGEVVRLSSGLYMKYGVSPDRNLRSDVEHGEAVDGIRAVVAIRALAGTACWDALNEIWDNWPTAVIEFTAFRMNVGQLGQPWVIWEVRDY